MKKIVKRACAGMFAALMAVSAMSVPSSASSISGNVGGNSCIGSNLITSKYASASTSASEKMTLSVKLYYTYADRTYDPDRRYTIDSSHADGNVTKVVTDCQKPTSEDIVSVSCYSEHDAVYWLLGNSYHWGGATKVNVY